MKYRIFVDMDGCLTDLVDSLCRICGFTMKGDKIKNISDELFWEMVNKDGVKFWSEMKWMPNGRKLWNLILPISPTILSACKDEGMYVVDGKKIWIKNNLGDVNYILCLRKEKQENASLNAVLIDDKEKTIQEWEQKGGIGILYCDNNFDNISKKIKKYLI